MRRTISRSRGRGYDDEQDLMNRIETGNKAKGSGGLPPWIDPDKAEKLIKSGWANPQIPSGQSDFTFMFDFIPYIAGVYDPFSAKGRKTHTCLCAIHEKVGPRNLSMLCRDAHVNKFPLKERAAEAREVTWGSSKEKDGCAICADREKMRAEGADYDDLKPYYYKQRNLYNARFLISREEMKIVKPWNISFHYMEKFLLSLARETYRPDEEELQPFINFASPTENGKSIKVTLGKKTLPMKNKGDKPIVVPDYDGHSFKDRRNALERAVLAQAICLDDLLIIPSADEVYKAHHAKSSPAEKSEKSSPEWAGDLVDDFSNMDDLEGELDNKTKRELMKFVLDYNIPLDIDDMDDLERDDLVEAITDECEDFLPEAEDEGGSSTSAGKNDCPYGFRFGIDVNEKDECEKCPTETWTACLDKSRK